MENRMVLTLEFDSTDGQFYASFEMEAPQATPLQFGGAFGAMRDAIARIIADGRERMREASPDHLDDFDLGLGKPTVLTSETVRSEVKQLGDDDGKEIG